MSSGASLMMNEPLGTPPNPQAPKRLSISSLFLLTVVIVAATYFVLSTANKPSYAQDDFTKTPTPSMTRTRFVLPTRTPSRTPNPTQFDQTLDALAATRLRASAVVQVTRTASAGINATINAKVNAFLTATAKVVGTGVPGLPPGSDLRIESLVNQRFTLTAQPQVNTAIAKTVDAEFYRRLTATAENGPTKTRTPTPNATTIQQTADVIISTRVQQGVQLRLTQTASAIIQATVNAKINELMTATAGANK